MLRKMVKNGNSLVLFIDKSVCDLFGWVERQDFFVSRTPAGGLLARPATDADAEGARTKTAGMIKKLVKYGNSLGLVIDKPICEVFGWKQGTQFEMKMTGTSLVMTPVPEAEPETPAAKPAAKKRRAK